MSDSSPMADGLTRRHFALQNERPEHLEDVDLIALDPLLRSLLFTDGTVTRTLEVQALAAVSVDVVEQRNAPVRGPIASGLQVPPGTEAIRRRVAIETDSAPDPAIWAESHIVPIRLPKGFLGVLGESPEGIGQSLQQVKLESWREMLWFGLDAPPGWAGPRAARGGAVLRRFYRVISQARPAMVISESFAIELRSGTYRLAA